LSTDSFKFIAFASPAGGLRNCNAAAFASYAVTVLNSKHNSKQYIDN